jgi:hypothetical protein
MARIGPPCRAACGRTVIVENRSVTVQVCYRPGYGIAIGGHLRCDIVEGHRYADDAEPSWYADKTQYEGKNQYDADISGSHSLGNPYDSGVQERPSGAFRLPEQRPADAAGGYAVTDPLITTGSHARPPEPPAAAYDARPPEPPAAAYDARVSVRGPQYPTIRPFGEMPPDPVAPSMPAGPPPPPPPISALPQPMSALPPPMAEPTTLVPPVTRQPETVYHTRRPVSSVIVAIVMIVLMIPVVRLLVDATFSGDPTSRAVVPAVLLTLGFALTGIGLFTIARGGPLNRESWLRPPVAYLPAGLILLVAAGLAVA